jgi:uncharacterized protein
MSLLLNGSTPIKPTEDPESVLRCILNIFPDCDHQVKDSSIEFSTSDLDKFTELLYDQQIRDTAVMVLGKGLRDDSTSFYLNKQAAFMVKINFSDGDSNLGDLEIKVVKGAIGLIENITPRVD